MLFLVPNTKLLLATKLGKKRLKMPQAGHKPCKNPNKSGNQFAKRILDAKYGAGNWKAGPGTEHNQIKKYGDRAFK